MRLLILSALLVTICTLYIAKKFFYNKLLLTMVALFHLISLITYFTHTFIFFDTTIKYIYCVLLSIQLYWTIIIVTHYVSNKKTIDEEYSKYLENKKYKKSRVKLFRSIYSDMWTQLTLYGTFSCRLSNGSDLIPLYRLAMNKVSKKIEVSTAIVHNYKSLLIMLDSVK